VREVEITTACPECRGDHLVRDYSRAEIVCEDCGLVLDDMIIDEGPEWRAFDSEQRESRERAGPPSTIMAHDKGLSTSIGWRNKDAYGRQIPHKSRAQIYRLRKWQHRIRTSKSGERSLAQGLTEINTMASKMGLPRHVR
jgi:transcription initiation factor TFIIB